MLIEILEVRNWGHHIDSMKREVRVHCGGSLKRSWREKEVIRQ